ncbi:LysR family transcriptional regulator [Fundidesulfovibrio soli]|uniref:LysR family transcriptional regulator n=1 Tax=Fundidesulfovibrio soli TaxID=2922716 RepID=UPI001FAEB5DD|nr:LysR family transcriptional regulator [Fundidesulfovibrio soli]
MELSDLQAFQAVAQCGGVTQAAQRLNKVQSGVSARIKNLERELGVELFARQGRGMVLTANGRSLLDYADKILLLAREAVASVTGQAPSGRFRLGAMESTSASRLPQLLGAFHTRYPEVALELTTGTSADLARAVREFGLDAAFVSEPVHGEGLEKRPAYREELVLVAASTQPALTSPERLGSLALLVFSHGCAYRKRLEDWAASGGKAPRTVELGSYQTMLGCAASGMGVAIMPRSVTGLLAGTAGVSVHELPPEISRVRTSLVWRKGDRTGAVRALAAMLDEQEDCTPLAGIPVSSID